MSLALSALNSMFRKYCEEYKRLFLPGQNDLDIAESLVDFYEKYFSAEILERSVEYYVKTTTEPILIYNFALESSKIRDHIVKEMEIKEQFNTLVQQTKERMERFNEL
jgi:poly-beta-hydroxyalkanoate depolymerase